MQESETFFPNFVGTPPGYRRVGFYLPDGSPRVACAKIEGDWNVSVFCEPENYRIFCVATSPDKEGLVLIRWLSRHAPVRQDYATSAAQRAALNGKDATDTHAQLLAEAQATLTENDNPTPVVVPPLQLAEASGNDYRVREHGDKHVIDCQFRIPSHISMETHSPDGSIQAAFYQKGRTEAFFLSDAGGDYRLEAVRLFKGLPQRRSALSPKSGHTGQDNATIIAAMVPSLG